MAATSSTGSKKISDEELADPSPDILKLFDLLNHWYFWGQLSGVKVKWSKKPLMVMCAGLCSYQRKSGKCTINLSKPLLKRRSRKDLIESLLHEMIHAYLCINNIKESDMHGPVFCSHMQRINTAGRFHITTFHTFHKEVEFYDNKWYRCDGPCNTKKPYYGFCVPYSRAKPSWWDQHKTNCGGKFKKVQRPDLGDLLGKSKP
ncbi:DNA-dependent metalloprotease SPRTN-like [Bombina bombina]|uniref:DNA-dependent metalloprotease SPRTN-like n=1 Tax=Bombina bombina TaxID=8345 RepID=UPI00235AE6B3|nr:DNA-dependent metalloprotease SPRTN-like [Bombina bombina]